MYIEHLALWTNQLEVMKTFYVEMLGATSNQKYTNEKKQFSSYFLSFDSGCRLELMQMTGIEENPLPSNSHTGLVHFAMGVDSAATVDQLTESLRSKGVKIYSEPRRTGDRYYESVIQDPDGNLVEIAAG